LSPASSQVSLVHCIGLQKTRGEPERQAKARLAAITQLLANEMVEQPAAARPPSASATLAEGRAAG